jgi:tetratricopeptide (TPR) repeat protein
VDADNCQAHDEFCGECRTMSGKTKPGKPGPRGGRDLLGQAQDLIYDAWEIDDPAKRAAIARKALKISPDCSDAYVLLAEAATTPVKALEFYRKGVAAGERALGRQTFEDEVGHFWGLLETRPYMRARAGLALSLWARGQHDEAIAHWRAMLILNPNDNQGIRYVLAARLLELDRDRELAALLKEHRDDGRAYLIWANALLLFRTHGDDAKSRRALVEALASNPHVPVYLLGHQPIPQELPDYTGFGDESEAMCLAAENIEAWKKTKGAFAWLAQNIVPAKPTLLN